LPTWMQQPQDKESPIIIFGSPTHTLKYLKSYKDQILYYILAFIILW